MNLKSVDAMAANATQTGNTTDSRKIGKAAHDFEALLVTQMLRSSHGEGGWLSSGDDQADDAALGMGEEELAQALANSGGIGLAKMIEAGLAKAPENAARPGTSK